MLSEMFGPLHVACVVLSEMFGPLHVACEMLSEMFAPLQLHEEREAWETV